MLIVARVEGDRTRITKPDGTLVGEIVLMRGGRTVRLGLDFPGLKITRRSELPSKPGTRGARRERRIDRAIARSAQASGRPGDAVAGMDARAAAAAASRGGAA